MHFPLHPLHWAAGCGGGRRITLQHRSYWQYLGWLVWTQPWCPIFYSVFYLGRTGQNTSRDLQSHTAADLIIQSKISTYRVFLAHLRICSYSCGGLVSTTNLCTYLLEQTKEMFVYSDRHSPTGSCSTKQPPTLGPSLPTLSHGSHSLRQGLEVQTMGLGLYWVSFQEGPQLQPHHGLSGFKLGSAPLECSSSLRWPGLWSPWFKWLLSP